MLTARKKKFIALYEGNATAAAKLAGYSRKTAKSIGQRLLTDVDVKKGLIEREKKETGPLIANRLERQMFWTLVMRNRIAELDKENGTDKPVNFETLLVSLPKMTDRLKASELLGKSEADFTEKILHQGLEGLADRVKKAEDRIHGKEKTTDDQK